MIPVVVGVNQTAARLPARFSGRGDECVVGNGCLQGIDPHPVIVSDDAAGVADAGAGDAWPPRLGVGVDVWRQLTQFRFPAGHLRKPLVLRGWNYGRETRPPHLRPTAVW